MELPFGSLVDYCDLLTNMTLNRIISSPTLSANGTFDSKEMQRCSPQGNIAEGDTFLGDFNKTDQASAARTESTYCLSYLSQSDDSSDDDVKVAPVRKKKENAGVLPHIGFKKVLVTGGAGFIGSYVADYLLQRGDEVIVIDEMNSYYDVRIKESNLALLERKWGTDKIKIYRGDICDEALLTEVFNKERPKWVCHMAARAGVRPSIQDPFVYIHSNIRGTTQLMEFSHKYDVQNFVFASSSSVYGGSKNTFFSEEESVDNPVSPYAASKKACELLAYTYHHLYNLNISALRFFTVYGPRGRPDMAPFKFIDRISQGLEIEQFGDGSSSRDYTYIDDIVDGVVRAIDRPHKYEVFNLGKGSGTSLRDFIDLVEKYTENKAVVKIMSEQPGDVPYTCADVNKATEMLGYQSKTSFEEGIERTVAWYKDGYGKSVEVSSSSEK